MFYSPRFTRKAGWRQPRQDIELSGGRLRYDQLILGQARLPSRLEGAYRSGKSLLTTDRHVSVNRSFTTLCLVVD